MARSIIFSSKVALRWICVNSCLNSYPNTSCWVGLSSSQKLLPKFTYNQFQEECSNSFFNHYSIMTLFLLLKASFSLLLTCLKVHYEPFSYDHLRCFLWQNFLGIPIDYICRVYLQYEFSDVSLIFLSHWKLLSNSWLGTWKFSLRSILCESKDFSLHVFSDVFGVYLACYSSCCILRKSTCMVYLWYESHYDSSNESCWWISCDTKYTQRVCCWSILINVWALIKKNVDELHNNKVFNTNILTWIF